MKLYAKPEQAMDRLEITFTDRVSAPIPILQTLGYLPISKPVVLRSFVSSMQLIHTTTTQP